MSLKIVRHSHKNENERRKREAENHHLDEKVNVKPSWAEELRKVRGERRKRRETRERREEKVRVRVRACNRVFF